MGDKQIGKDLHLPDLMIENFRGIKSLAIPRLGRVTLIAGKNSVGKTTVLDAVKLYASRGRASVLHDLLTVREEISVTTDEDGDYVLEPDLAALFHGRAWPSDDHVSIGSSMVGDQLSIKMSPLTDEQSARFARISPELLADDRSQVLKAVFQDNEAIVPWWFASRGDAGPRTLPRSTRNRLLHREYQAIMNESEPPPAISCESLGPGLLNNLVMARFWDRVALTEYEDHAVKALRLIFGDDVKGAAVIGEDTSGRLIGRRATGRRAIVKLRSQEQPVPLRSLGDGALRLFGVALALANSQGGFLLIDEAENGIHHSVQRDYWGMVLQTAQENNVQVLATTHSWDCVVGFAHAASENDSAEGVLVRLEHRGDRLRAVEYLAEDLETVAEQGIEVR